VHGPSANHSLLTADSQNRSMRQKIILEWPCQFRHLGLHQALFDLRHFPFVMPKFSATVKCILTKCEI